MPCRSGCPSSCPLRAVSVQQQAHLASLQLDLGRCHAAGWLPQPLDRGSP